MLGEIAFSAVLIFIFILKRCSLLFCKRFTIQNHSMAHTEPYITRDDQKTLHKNVTKYVSSTDNGDF